MYSEMYIDTARFFKSVFPMFKAIIITSAAIVLTILPALLQGQLLNRWMAPVDLYESGLRLHQFPRDLGRWTNTEDERPLADAVCRELGLEDHFHREYVHTETGERLNVLLMVGPPGRLVRHPPDVCYANRANQPIGEARSLQVRGNSQQNQFKLLHFKRLSQAMQSEFWVAHAYSSDTGTWSAPTSPRMAFGGAPLLYKLQVLSETSDFGEQEATADFLHQFVDAFPEVLTSTPENVGQSDEL